MRIKINQNTHRGFNFGMLSSLLVISILIFMKYFYRLLSDFDTIVFIILSLSFGVLSALGFINSIKGIKEPNTFKKIIGIILNIGFVVLFLYALASFVFDF
ncbi:hypothetical protein [Lutibacter sp.]